MLRLSSQFPPSRKESLFSAQTSSRMNIQCTPLGTSSGSPSTFIPVKPRPPRSANQICEADPRRIPHAYPWRQSPLSAPKPFRRRSPLQDITIQDVEQVISDIMDRFLWFCFRSQTLRYYIWFRFLNASLTLPQSTPASPSSPPPSPSSATQLQSYWHGPSTLLADIAATHLLSVVETLDVIFL